MPQVDPSSSENVSAIKAEDLGYERWLEAAAERIGLEVESVAAPYSNIESMLCHAGPALIAIHATELQFVVVLRATRRYLRVVAPDLLIRRVAIEEVETAICREAVAPHLQPIEHLLKEVGISGWAGKRAGAATVLSSAASQWGGAALLGAFVALAMWLTALNVRRREAWTDARLGLTNDLVERMIGHRTTLAQEPRGRAATETDQSLELYLDPSTRLDRSTVVLQSLLPRIWLLCGLLWLAPAFVSGSESVTRLAVSLGGLLLAKQGLQRLVEGLDRISGATVAWRRLRPFLAKPDHPKPVGEPDLVASRGSSNLPKSDDIVLDSRSVTFRHTNRSEAVLRDVNLSIRQRDRVLLEGPSGGGKSTLATLLSGARTPQAGVLLLRGLDRQTLGVAWRRRIVLAPQFHHNHVLMGTFLYNLLLGRAWPPTKDDAEAAEQLCRKLDLGPLIDRMPGGLLQMVGETGWQLSHGEKSRLFLARALLQQADVVLLDETFSALDPKTLSYTLPKVLELAPTLVVIAHP